MKHLPKVIGIAGKARTGKNTMANFIEAQYGGYQYSMAAPIRRMLKAGLNVDMDDPWWAERKEKNIPAIGKSPRQLMQTLGTEWGRQLIEPSIWITLALDVLRKRGPGMIVPDIRFENEAAWVRKMGGTVIHLSRKNAPGINPHVSENALLSAPSDIQFYNDAGLEEMQHAVSKLFGP
ncbi:MAG: deoxynucleotide monophosphate kinase [Actinomycetota bacterium]|nr:deoxynucleotide monophosphate kinase [Actinomycetota bacterium]